MSHTTTFPFMVWSKYNALKYMQKKKRREKRNHWGVDRAKEVSWHTFMHYNCLFLHSPLPFPQGLSPHSFTPGELTQEAFFIKHVNPLLLLQFSHTLCVVVRILLQMSTKSYKTQHSTYADGLCNQKSYLLHSTGWRMCRFFPPPWSAKSGKKWKKLVSFLEKHNLCLGQRCQTKL